MVRAEGEGVVPCLGSPSSRGTVVGFQEVVQMEERRFLRHLALALAQPCGSWEEGLAEERIQNLYASGEMEVVRVVERIGLL